jgi:hypothetical protein
LDGGKMIRAVVAAVLLASVLPRPITVRQGFTSPGPKADPYFAPMATPLGRTLAFCLERRLRLLSGWS